MLDQGRHIWNKPRPSLSEVNLWGLVCVVDGVVSQCLPYSAN